MASSSAEAVLILTQMRSGSDDTGGGAADDDGTTDNAGGAWLLGAAIDEAPCDDVDGVELGAWWEALPCDDTLGMSSSVLDSGKLELSRVDDSGRPDTSGNDAVDSNDDKLAVDVKPAAASLCSLSFWPPSTIAIMTISAANATKKPRDSKIVFLLIFFFSSMFAPHEK